RPPPPVRARPVLHVSSNPANVDAFPTIKQALARAEPGDRIVLLDEQHEEDLIVSSVKGTTAVTVEAAEGKSVVWTGRKTSDKAPLLHLAGAKGFHLKGKGITLDGQGRVEDL